MCARWGTRVARTDGVDGRGPRNPPPRTRRRETPHAPPARPLSPRPRRARIVDHNDIRSARQLYDSRSVPNARSAVTGVPFGIFENRRRVRRAALFEPTVDQTRFPPLHPTKPTNGHTHARTPTHTHTHSQTRATRRRAYKHASVRRRRAVRDSTRSCANVVRGYVAQTPWHAIARLLSVDLVDTRCFRRQFWIVFAGTSCPDRLAHGAA